MWSLPVGESSLGHVLPGWTWGVGKLALGELVPAYFPVPQNPITAGAANGLRYRPSIGEILPMRFKIRTNPVIEFLREGAQKEAEAAGMGACCAGCAQADEVVVQEQGGMVTALPADMAAQLDEQVGAALGGIGSFGVLVFGVGLGWLMTRTKRG